MYSTFKAALAVLLTTLIGSNSWAIGAAFIGNEVPSARAAGQGYVGVAGQNNDPTAVFTNPGAMTSLPGTQATFGMHWENIHGSYEDSSGKTTKEKVVNVAVPNFSMTQSMMEGKLAFGLSSQSPFGLETNWPGNSPLRYVATNSRLGMVDIMPAIAYSPTPMFSFGIGADYANVFRAQLDRHINNDIVNYSLFTNGYGGAITTGSPDAVSSLRGSGANWGYHIGAVMEPTEQHAIGLVYHSKIDVRLNGSYSISGITGPVPQAIFGGSNFTTSAYTDIVLPANVQLGYAFKPNDKWHLEVDAAWYHWSVSKDVNVRFPAATASQLSLMSNTSQGTNRMPLDLRDAWSFNTGANYKINEKWQVRGGAWYEPWASPEARFSPAFSDLSRYGVSSGFGYSLTENLTLDAAYTAVFFHNRSINNSVGTEASGIPASGVPLLGIPSPDVSGTYKNFANLLALNITYRFGSNK